MEDGYRVDFTCPNSCGLCQEKLRGEQSRYQQEARKQEQTRVNVNC